MPSPYAGAGIHSAYRWKTVYRCLHDQLAVKCLPWHSRSNLWPALRAGVPPWPYRRRTGSDLSIKTCRGRFQIRYHRSVALYSKEKEWQTHCLDRRRACLTHCCSWFIAPRLRDHLVWSWQGERRCNAYPDSQIQAPGRGVRRRTELHPRYGHQLPVWGRNHQHENITARRFRCHIRWHWCSIW